MVKKLTRDQILAQLPAARAQNRKDMRAPWWPVEAKFEMAADALSVRLRSGYTIIIPRSQLKELRRATLEELKAVELAGEAVRWDDLDVDISVPGLLKNGLGENFFAREAGRSGGSVRSKAKTLAARANGKKGGRPRKAVKRSS